MKLAKVAKKELKIFKMDEITIVHSSSNPSGSYGEVSPAIINDGNIPVALKKYKTDVSSIILDGDIIREIVILQHLNQYPETSTVGLLGICFDNPRRHCFLVLESLETDFHRISVKYKSDASKYNGRYNNREYKIIFYKCLKALNAIHSLGFIHNDIKLGNIMLNGTDIKFIDFGLTKYIGLSPLFQQVNTYSTTDVIKAPEKRISFSTDMFSIASTMIHLAMRDYRKLRVDKSGEIYDFNNHSEAFNTYLGLDRVFGPDGLDLLIKLMNTDPKIRLCANEALRHQYFDDIRGQNQDIDRTVVGLMGGNPINGLSRQIDYSEDNFKDKNFELCYYEELHINYMGDICPIQLITNDIMRYHTLMNWLLGKFNDSVETARFFYGIDVIINGIITTKTNFVKYQQTSLLLSPIINTMCIDATFNMLIFRDIYTDGRLDVGYMLENRVKSSEFVSYFYNNLNINIDMYPISVHISYIYLQLFFEIKKLKNGFTIERDFFNDICLNIIFWFIQPIPFNEPVTIFEAVVFSVIKLLSKILMVSGIELIQNPIIPILTMYEMKYQKMLDYFYLQYLSFDFQTFRNYNIYFNNPIFLPPSN